jgi:hypothetical protein
MYFCLVFNVANNYLNYLTLIDINGLISLFILAEGYIIKEFISRGFAGFIVNDACETKVCA